MRLFKRNQTGLFASESLTGHLIRGGVGVLLLVWAMQHQARTGVSLVAALGALLAFRGCPMCWTIGLVESVAQKVQHCRKT